MLSREAYLGLADDGNGGGAGWAALSRGLPDGSTK
jgi:hypothetical protein